MLAPSLLALLVLAPLVAGVAPGPTTLAAWNFDSTVNPPNSGPLYKDLLQPDAGWSSTTTPVMLTTGSGTAVNATQGLVAGTISPGTSVQIYGSTSSYTPMVGTHFYTGGWNVNNASIIWCFSSLGYTGVTFQALLRVSGTGPSKLMLSYSTTGANAGRPSAYTNVTNPLNTPPNTFIGINATNNAYYLAIPSTQTADSVLLGAGADNKANLCVKLGTPFLGPAASSSGGTAVFDNILFAGWPPTPTQTQTASQTGTPSISPSATQTGGLDPSQTSTNTQSATSSASASATATLTASSTASPSFTPVLCNSAQIGVPPTTFQAPGVSIVAVRVGSGTTNIQYNNGVVWPSFTLMPAFVEELSLSSGAVLQSIPLPGTTAADNSTRRCNVGVGNNYNEGNGALSFDGMYYSVPCWDVAVGTQFTNASTRTIARVDGFGNVDTRTSWMYEMSGANLVYSSVTAHVSALFNGTGFFLTNQGGTRFVKYGAPWNGGASTFTSGSARALTAAYGYVWQASTSPSINRWTQAGVAAGSPLYTIGKMTGMSGGNPHGIAVQNATQFWVCDNNNVPGLTAFTVQSNGTAFPIGNMVIPATGEPVANPVPQPMVTQFDYNGVRYNAPGCRGMSGYVDSTTGHYTLVYATGAPMFQAGVVPLTSNLTATLNNYNIAVGNFIVKFDTYTYTATAIARACGNTEYKGVAMAPQPPTPSSSTTASVSSSATVTSTSSVSASSSVTPASTASSTSTSSASASASQTAASTLAADQSPSTTGTPPLTATSTASSSATPTTSPAATVTPTKSAVPTVTPTPSVTPTLTPTGTVTPSAAATSTPSPTCGYTTVSSGAPFLPGNLVAVRIGSGAAALVTTATAFSSNSLFLDEFPMYGSGMGTNRQTIALPVTVGTPGAGNLACTGGTGSIFEGIGSTSADGATFTIPCWNIAPASTFAASTTKVVAVVSPTGSIDTTTSYVDASVNQVASCSPDGVNLYAYGYQGSRYIRFGNPGTTIAAGTGAVSLNGGNGRVMISSNVPGWKGLWNTALGSNRIWYNPTEAPVSTTGFNILTSSTTTTVFSIAVQGGGAPSGGVGNGTVWTGDATPTGSSTTSPLTAWTCMLIQCQLYAKYSMPSWTWNGATVVPGTTTGIRAMAGFTSTASDSSFGHYMLVMTTSPPSPNSGNYIILYDTTFAGTSGLAVGLQKSCPNTLYSGVGFAPVALPSPSPSATPAAAPIVVLQAGVSDTALSTAATALSLITINPMGTQGVQQSNPISIPSTGAAACTQPGVSTTTTVGGITLSPTGNTVWIPCYSTIAGAAINSTTDSLVLGNVPAGQSYSAWATVPISSVGSNTSLFSSIISHTDNEAWIGTTPNGAFYFGASTDAPVNIWPFPTYGMAWDPNGILFSTNKGGGTSKNILSTAYPTTSAGVVSYNLATATSSIDVAVQDAGTVWATGYSTGLSLFVGSGSSYARADNWPAALKFTYGTANGITGATVSGARAITGFFDAGRYVLYICTANGTSPMGGNVVVQYTPGSNPASVSAVFWPIAQAPNNMDFRGVARAPVWLTPTPTSSNTPSSSSTASPSGTSSASRSPAQTPTPAVTTTPAVTQTPSGTASSSSTSAVTTTPASTSSPAATTSPASTMTSSVSGTPASTSTPVETSSPAETTSPATTPSPAETTTPAVTVSPAETVTSTSAATSSPASTVTASVSGSPAVTPTAASTPASICSGLQDCTACIAHSDVCAWQNSVETPYCATTNFCAVGGGGGLGAPVCACASATSASTANATPSPASTTDATPSPASTADATSSPSGSTSASASPSSSSSAASTADSTSTPESTGTPAITVTPASTATASVTSPPSTSATAASSKSTGASSSATAAKTFTATASGAKTFTATASGAKTITPAATSSPHETISPTGTRSPTRTPSGTKTGTSAATQSTTNSPANTQSKTGTAAVTRTKTATKSPASSKTSTAAATRSKTGTAATTRTPTESKTASGTPALSKTATSSKTSSPAATATRTKTK